MAENKPVETTETAEKKTNKERLKEITDSIEKGIKELFQSDKYKEYLSVMSRFHRYSVNNQMLIFMQKPGATLVAGFNKWHDRFGRNVKKGEKGIKIIAPTPFKKKVEETKLDPDTRLPMMDEKGNPIMEEKEIEIPMFRVVSVFDVSQTFGKPLPQLASDLSGDVKNYDAFMEAIKRSTSLPITFEDTGKADGYFSVNDQKIVIREGMSEVQTVSALLHELAHSRLHNEKLREEKLQEVEVFGKKMLFSNERIDADYLPVGLYCYDLRGSDNDPGIPITIEEKVMVNHAGCLICAEPLELGKAGFLSIQDELFFTGAEKGIQAFWREHFPEEANRSRNTEEVEAESISYAVCSYYGIQTAENSLGYIASWSQDKELPELKHSLETINRTSSSMISDIDRHYAEVMKERGVDISKPEIEEGIYESTAHYLYVMRNSENTWDYAFYDKDSLREVDGGRLDNHEMNMEEAKEEILKIFEVKLPYEGPLDREQTDKIMEDILESDQNLMDKMDMIDKSNEENKQPVVARAAAEGEHTEKIAKAERPSLLAKLQKPLPERTNTEKPKFKEREI